MTQTNIQFREIQPSDYNALEKIICKIWDYERFCAPRTAKALSKVYLAACLCNQTFTCVAMNQGEPVGVIMGKNEKNYRSSLRYIFRQMKAVISMLTMKEGRRVLKLFGGFDNINKNLLAQSHKKYEGELAFFAVRDDQQGTGIGKELFRRLKEYMKSQGIETFYLFTDTTCNYGFYEHQGMERICENKQCLKAYGNKEVSFFMYGY